MSVVDVFGIHGIMFRSVTVPKKRELKYNVNQISNYVKVQNKSSNYLVTWFTKLS